MGQAGSAIKTNISAIKDRSEKSYKGASRLGGKIYKGVKNYDWKGFHKGFKKGFAKVGKAVQKPAAWIKEKDPLKDSMGAASPIALGADIALAPMTGAGYLMQLSADDKLQKKLAAGDPDTIMDTTFSGVSLVPMGYAARGVKAGYKGTKSGLRKAGRAISKLF